MKAKKIIIGILIILITAIAVGLIAFGINSKTSKELQTNAMNPIMGSIEQTVSETGLVTVDDTYSVISSVNAKIESCEFAEGDAVNKGQVLYRLDHTGLSNQIHNTQISLDKANETYRQNVKAADNLTVKSYANGMITTLYLHKGDYVSTGAKIADVVDSGNLILKIPFNSSDRSVIYTGAGAEITMSGDGSTLYGIVSKIYDETQSFDGGKSGIMTEISVTNPGALKKGDKAFVKVGTAASLSSGEFSNRTEQTIIATQTGQVQELYIREGAAVSNGMKVMVIENDTLTNNVKNTSLQIKEIQTNLSQLQASLSDYQIVSPVNGVVTKRMAKEADYATPQAALSEIASSGASYVETDIDELYINQVAVGQNVKVNLQDGSDAEYSGKVVEISNVGTTKSGVTYYAVKIELNSYDNLMNAMNVKVNIITGNKENVMLIPSKAINGGKVTVLNGKKTIEKEVQTGVKNSEYIEILSGLSLEDKMIAGGQTK